jgi:hypothetical protein
MMKKIYLPVILIFLLLFVLNFLFSPEQKIVVAQSGTATPTLSCIQPSNVDIAFTYCDAAHNDIAQDYSTPLEDVSTNKYIPPVILKAMGAQESTWTQCNADNTPFSSANGCDWGMMQISSGMDCTAPPDQFNAETRQQVKYDNRYNIGMGVHILEQKWNWHQQNNRIIGDGSPNIAEHWYYAVWAYNKWTKDNSPNPDVNPCLLWPNSNVDCAYQDKVWWWAAHPLTGNGNALWSIVDLTRPDNLDDFPTTAQEMSTWTGWQIDDPVPVHKDSCRDYLPLVLKNWPETYFFETFNPTHSGWIFTGSKDIGPPGRTDGASLRLYEGASGSITISVPPNSTPILTYWCKDDDLSSYSYPRFDLYLDGVDTTPGMGGNNLSCSSSWGRREQVIGATYTSDGQVTIKFQAASLPIWNTRLRFDDILVQSQ